jgi:predicted transcriptional regulator
VSYTQGVKTAVSVPDELCDRAEAAAKRLRLSRSSLSAKAISEFLERSEAGQTTGRIEAICAVEDTWLDRGLKRLQDKTRRGQARR